MNAQPYAFGAAEQADDLLERAIVLMRERAALTNSAQDYQAVNTLNACRRPEVAAQLDLERLARAVA